ncbi:MAG: type II toxin-antitoxin system RelE/ParE family toxin [Patescibacteria group bacterium]
MGQEEYSLKYHRLIPADLERIDSFWREHIGSAIKDKLTTQPELFGKPLRHSLKGCRSLRVEDYRVIFQIEEQFVKVVIIGHRRDVYRGAEKRV